MEPREVVAPDVEKEAHTSTNICRPHWPSWDPLHTHTLKLILNFVPFCLLKAFIVFMPIPL